MQVALARRGFSPSGGAEGYLRRLVHALAAAGHDVTFYGSPEWPQTEDWALPTTFFPVPGRTPRAFADALAQRRVAKPKDGTILFSLERVWRCDVFRAGDGVHRAWLERRGRAPWRDCFNPKHRQLLALEAALLGPAGGARAVIANSGLVRREILRVYGTPAGRVHVVPNGLPAEAFAPVPAGLRETTRARLGLVEPDFVVLFAGSGWERKGLRFALAAVGLLPAALRPVLLVAGAGEPPPSAEKTHARARFLGPVPPGEMRALFAAADVFVLPTLYDPFSNACLEALAAGLPVVTTADNGFSEVLTPGADGEVVPHGADVDALATALRAWADPARRTSAREAIRAKAARFTIGENLARTLAVLETVVVPG